MSPSPRPTRFHGRVGDGSRACAVPGCAEPGEFRAPPVHRGGLDADPAARWRWLCLDHVRAFNAGFNYFAGMSPDEITAAQTPYAGWQRETRAFASNGAAPPPRWSDFADPLDALGARFAPSRRAAETAARSPRERALAALDLPLDADARAVRRRYAALVRRYHPDHNGGDRSHEKALQAVVAAYTALRRGDARVPPKDLA